MPINAQVTKWGNSLAIRIPKTVAAEAGYVVGDRIEFNVEKGPCDVAAYETAAFYA